jgi:hypothetical protein
MPTTTLTIGNDVLSTTQYVLMKEWRDALHTSVGFLDAQTRIHGQGGPTQAGGSRIIQPFGVTRHSNATELITGYEHIDSSVQDFSKPASFEWAFTTEPVAISGVEEFINSGEAAILSILDGRTKDVANKMKQDFVRQVVKGDAASWTRWNTLNGVDFTGVANSAFLEENAVGAQTNIIGGLSKATYSSAPGLQNQVFNGANSFNANGLAGLYSLGTEARAVSPSGPFDVWLVSRDCFNNLKRSLSAQERYLEGAGDGGKLVEYWNGVRIDVEYYMPDDGAVTATTPISAYALNMQDIYCMWGPDGYFDMGDFMTISGEQDVRIAKMTCIGQLIAKHFGSSGLAHSLDTF